MSAFIDIRYINIVNNSLVALGVLVDENRKDLNNKFCQTSSIEFIKNGKLKTKNTLYDINFNNKLNINHIKIDLRYCDDISFVADDGLLMLSHVTGEIFYDGKVKYYLSMFENNTIYLNILE